MKDVERCQNTQDAKKDVELFESLQSLKEARGEGR